MRLLPRPSKSFLFDYLSQRLARTPVDVALDAASAGFKNRAMFRTRVYLGVDIRLEVLREGRAGTGSERDLGLLADLSRLDMLPDNCVDLVVSSNTLYHLPPEDRMAAVRHMCRVTRPSGWLYCDLPKDAAFPGILATVRAHFGDVAVRHYRNLLSTVYESVLCRGGLLGGFELDRLPVVRTVAWVIGRLEFLTGVLPGINSQALVVATAKSGGEFRRLDLAGLPLIEPGIYDARVRGDNTPSPGHGHEPCE